MDDGDPRPPAGWYNADGKPGNLRYWDGERWTDQTGKTAGDRNLVATNAVLWTVLAVVVLLTVGYLVTLFE